MTKSEFIEQRRKVTVHLDDIYGESNVDYYNGSLDAVAMYYSKNKVNSRLFIVNLASHIDMRLSKFDNLHIFGELLEIQRKGRKKMNLEIFNVDENLTSWLSKR